MIILGIETSCDETAAAVIRGEGERVEVLSNIISSQIEIHKKWGGVIPEVAAREHVLSILPVVSEALKTARIKSTKLDSIAVTVGPGLITSLIAGVETAKTLSYTWGMPLIGVNHIAGHIYANFIHEDAGVNFPALILTVSGGHNLLVLMQGHGKFKIIGETLDDAAGEAFDKAAQILNLGYPGGPAIADAAAKFQIPNSKYQINSKNEKSIVKGSLLKVTLPRPMINTKNYDFSFSGLKTALLYQVKNDPGYKKRISEYAYEFQRAVIDVLIHKTIKAAQEFKVKTIMLAGGVSANKELRKQMENAVKKNIPNSQFFLPNLSYTTDNAAMIAAAGYFQARQKRFTSWQKIKADCNLELK